MSEDKVKVAMIGLGFGAEFLPIYQDHPRAEVGAICRRNEAELNRIGDRLGIEKRYTDYERVLADPEIDFVHINSPIPDHAWMSLAALDAGKHVMCTVPMATGVEDCRRIVEKVRQTGLKYMMAETVVYSREFLFIRDLYQKGEFPRGSMGPKVRAAIDFLDKGGKRAIVTDPATLPSALNGSGGTHIIGAC